MKFKLALQQNKWRKIVIILGCIVVFCTTYALILPALTLSNGGKYLNCQVEVHKHTEECYNSKNELDCGKEDFIIHHHDDYCYDSEDNLVCMLPAIEAHTHTDDCYSIEKKLICEDPHEHTDECYEDDNVLICEKDEVILHTHDKDCYDENDNLICEKKEILEHQHKSKCWHKLNSVDNAKDENEETEETDYNSTDVGPILSEASKYVDKTVSETPEKKFSFFGANLLADSGIVVPTYVKQIAIYEMFDGTGPFDNTDTPGNDSSDKNGIVRSFDSVNYDVIINMASSSNENYTNADLIFGAVLEADPTKATFDSDMFTWLDTYRVIYFDADGNIVGNAVNGIPHSADINNLANQDNNYSTGGTIAYQLLVGNYQLQGKGSVVIPGTQTVKAGIKINASENGTQYAPTFFAATSEEELVCSASLLAMANPEYENCIKTALNVPQIPNVNPAAYGGSNKYVKSDVVTVSAAPRYNLRLQKNALNYPGDFDLSTGQRADSGSDPANVIHGNMLGYAVTVQLYNETDNTEPGALEGKALKGIELPKGDITFTLQFAEQTNSSGGVINNSEYTPVLWDYKPNINDTAGTAADPGLWGRNMLWNSSTTALGIWEAPINQYRSPYVKDTYRECYNGGTWYVDPSQKSVVSSTSLSQPYTITISGYDFDMEKITFRKPGDDKGTQSGDTVFPTHDWGDANASFPVYIGCFAAGYFEVVMQYPEEVGAMTSIYMSALVGGEVDNGLNLKSFTLDASSTSGQKCLQETTFNDNVVTSTVTLDPKGSINKYNSFNSMANNYMLVEYGFLGTEFWGQNYDAAAFAGTDIYIAGSTNLSRDSARVITDGHHLQKFDSSVFTIIKDKPIYIQIGNLDGTVSNGRPLYGADPLYPGGWNSNIPEEFDRMNRCDEDDLIFFDSLDELEAAGYTCIAVMGEYHSTPENPINMTADKKMLVQFPVHITDDPELVGNTVATINSTRCWDISQHDAVKDLDRTVNGPSDYPTADFYLDYDHSSSWQYVKSEFDNGILRPGTHLGEQRRGMSLLILGYKAAINVIVNKEVYSMDRGERTATFTMTGIETKISSANSDQNDTSQTALTDLTVYAEVGSGLELIDGSYYYGGIKISGDPANPTVIIIADKHGYPVQSTIYYEPVPEDELIKDDDGMHSAVRFQLSNVPVGVPLENITYSTTIGHAGFKDDVSNNDRLKVYAEISGTGDRRAYSTVNGNIASTEILVTKLTQTGIQKLVDKQKTELDEEFTYSIIYSNNSEVDIYDVRIIDTLPYNGDSRGSSFHGTYIVTEVDVEFLGNSVDTHDIDIFVHGSDDTNITWQNSNVMFNGSDGYLATAHNGTLHEVNNSAIQNVATLGIEATKMPSDSVMVAKITLKPNGNEAADVYINNATSGYDFVGDNIDETKIIDSNTVMTEVYKRNLSGLAWSDENHNGIRDEGEELLPNIVVSLYKQQNDGSYIPATDIYGNQIDPVFTDANGEYMFENLAGGNYKVLFSNVDSVYGNRFNSATKYQADSANSTNNSDAKEAEVSAFEYQIFTHQGVGFVSMPRLDLIEDYVYSSPHWDIGLIKYDYMLPNTGGEGIYGYMACGAFLICASLAYGYILWRRRKECVVE
ncbi:MAG: hypothetical protein MJ089_06105 [Ruminococcus sp.]|nr:hypothetical protein [Ruminococcus sp.]